MRTAVRSLLMLLVVPLAAIAVAGCGSGGGGGDVDAVLKQTFGGGKPTRSGRLNIALALNLKGGSVLTGPVSLKIGGPFESRGKNKLPKFDFSLAIGAGNSKIAAGAVSVGDKGYLTLQGSTYQLAPDVFASFRQGFEQAEKQPEGSKDNPSFASLGINPRKWLKDAKEAGDANVAGAATTHITAGVNVGKLLDDVNGLLKRAGSLGIASSLGVPTQLSDKQRKQIGEAVKDARVDLYTGKSDRILRRLAVRFAFEIPASERRSFGGLRSGNAVLEYRVEHVNESQSIKAPANAKPFSELARVLQGVLGGVIGGGSSSTGGASPVPVPSGGASGAVNKKLQRYTNCLTAAAGDIRKAQKCATLLNP